MTAKVFADDVVVISLLDQLDWAETCLKKMQDTCRPRGEVSLQESICLTLSGRIAEKNRLDAAVAIAALFPA